jgi:hypothetical protein
MLIQLRLQLKLPFNPSIDELSDGIPHGLGRFTGDSQRNDDDDGDSYDYDHADHEPICVNLFGEVFEVFFSPKLRDAYRLRVVSVSLS